MGDISDSIGTAWEYFVVKTNGFSKFTYPTDSNMCWYAKSGDDVGCGSGYPFSSSPDVHVDDSRTVSKETTNPPPENYIGVDITSESLRPVAGPRPDFTPDFDVYHLDGHEISANCDDCPTEKVRPGQVVHMRLEVETHNRDVQVSDLRNSGTDSIDGKISCRVVGKTSWQEIPGSENGLEYDVDNLETDNNSSVERIDYTIPNYPGAVLECQAIVDEDDEVIEESESNNQSRIERFLIEDYAWLVPIMNSMNQ